MFQLVILNNWKLSFWSEQIVKIVLRGGKTWVGLSEMGRTLSWCDLEQVEQGIWKANKSYEPVKGRFTMSLAITFCAHFRIFVGAVQNKYPEWKRGLKQLFLTPIVPRTVNNMFTFAWKRLKTPLLISSTSWFFTYFRFIKNI